LVNANSNRSSPSTSNFFLGMYHSDWLRNAAHKIQSHKDLNFQVHIHSVKCFSLPIYYTVPDFGTALASNTQEIKTED